MRKSCPPLYADSSVSVLRSIARPQPATFGLFYFLPKISDLARRQRWNLLRRKRVRERCHLRFLRALPPRHELVERTPDDVRKRQVLLLSDSLQAVFPLGENAGLDGGLVLHALPCAPTRTDCPQQFADLQIFDFLPCAGGNVGAQAPP